ncbi:MAG: hypothetical protein QF906_02000 [Dehalococcoidales bacterium]|jgi:predicted PurR-regulated permease PerM|nr:hypothetical protein [Dehalococcoidales bacterium]MDP6043669.1 hypothetical protein [Dehalococcoidales bacterium]MDP6576816.1 hypothetical protein [Dehalococcoidales bacterium]MDP7285804.1 hypothetical protein [Dehalococcoidales bacterium]MDP7415607.1 hypothetical protein [Dehalococcoidales bacterium]
MKRVLVVTITALIIFVLLDIFLMNGQAHNGFSWSHLAGFFSLFGFLGCLALIAVAKLLGHYWLQRDEDHYDNDDDNE